jgi:hypothetical protein
VKSYDHFNERVTVPEGATGSSSKCRLWDLDEAQNDVANVIRARDAAVLAQTERAAIEGVDINAVDLAVEAPKAAPRVGPDFPAHLRLAVPHYPQARLPRDPGAWAAAMAGVNPRNRPGIVPLPVVDNFNLPPWALPPAANPLAENLPPPGPLEPRAQIENIRAWRNAQAPLDPEGIVADFQDERRRIREIRERRREQAEQMRILNGPPAIRADRRRVRFEERDLLRARDNEEGDEMDVED